MTTKAIVVPLKDQVYLPNSGDDAPVYVQSGDAASALKKAHATGTPIILTMRKDGSKPLSEDNLYDYGTVAEVVGLEVFEHEGKPAYKATVKLGDRAKINEYAAVGSLLLADDLTLLPDVNPQPSQEFENEVHAMVGAAETYFKKAQSQEIDVIMRDIERINGVPKSLDYLYLKLDSYTSERDDLSTIANDKKQAFLAEADVRKRVDLLRNIFVEMAQELDMRQETDKKLAQHTQEALAKQQKEYYLAQQMAAIRKELGHDGEDEIEKYKKRAEEAKLPEKMQKRVMKEITKLEGMAGMFGGGSEGNVVRNWLDHVLNTPWETLPPPEVDVHEAAQILEENHFGMDKVKERILEYLVVQERLRRAGKQNEKPAILCLDGPPGVGKTSLLKEVARAANRPYVRMALGGINHEADIRGHRKTYVGAMPGRIIKAMQEAGSTNALVALDEVDKVTSGGQMNGDPTAALLEVLDPEQNHSFRDHYIDEEYDLSNVLFIATSNYRQNIPEPLQDRMEIITIPGYTVDEKLEIAKRHLLHRALRGAGLSAEEFQISDDALLAIVEGYTREAGVRGLAKVVDTVARKVATSIERGEYTSITVTGDNLADIIGPKKLRKKVIDGNDQIGMTNGLFYSQVGGGVLQIEATKMRGKAGIRKTGRIKEVMQESVDAAVSYIRSNADKFKEISDTDQYDEIFTKNEIHIHFPDGATPKDGPSAGLAIATTLASLVTGIPVRRDIAMTGEINLRGQAGVIGGLKEKLLGALDAGVKTVFVPRDNEGDLADMPQKVIEGLEIIVVDHIDEVLAKALVDNPFVNTEPKVAAEQDNKAGVVPARTRVPKPDVK